MERTHDEIAELLGVYALDAVDDEEREAVERHLTTCPRCAAEVAEHREVAASLAHTGAPAPEGLWTRIVESLEEPPPAMDVPMRSSTSHPGAVTDLGARRAERRSWREWLPLSAAAAVLVVVGLIGGVLIGNATRSESPGTDVAAPISIDDIARRVLNDPAAAKVSLTSTSDDSLQATAAVEPDGSGYLLGTSLPALDASHTYQLWGVRPDAVISLGILGNSPGVVAFHLDDNIETLVITAEVEGGVAQSSNPALLVGNVT